jgi:lia operon protein LiaG
MKVAKIGLAIGAMLLASHVLHAQEFKIQVSNSANTELELKDFIGELTVTGYNGNEIIVTGSEGTSLPDKARGLKRVYPAGEDNTGAGLFQTKTDNKISLECLLPIGHEGSYTLKIPNNLKLTIDRKCGQGDQVNVSGMTSEVDITNCQDINLSNVSGPLVLNSISGEIKVVFTQVNKDKPINIANISGDIDVTIPASTPMNLEMSNLSGNMYSDFDISSQKKDDMRRVGGGSIQATLNGGGVPIKLHNISGNIYLRKG